MSYLDSYKNRVNYQGSNEKDRVITRMTNDFTKYLKDSPNKEIINYKEADYNVVILRDRQKENLDQKIILGERDIPLSVGSVFSWENTNWLLLMQDKMKIDSHFRGYAREAADIMNVMDDEGNIHACPVYIQGTKKQALKNTIVTEEDIVVVEDVSEISILASKECLSGIKIKLEDRFFLNKKVWKTVTVDEDSVKGIVFVKFLKDKIDPSIDNEILEIANYYDKKPIEDQWAISIHTQPKIDLIVNNLYDIDDILTIQVEKNEVAIDYNLVDIEWIYDSSKVDITGNTLTPLTNGEVEVSVRLVDYPDALSSVVLNVSPTATIEYKITGDDRIRWNRSEKYSVVKLDDGTPVTTTFTFSLEDASNLAQIISQDGTNCTIKANDDGLVGVITLVADNGNAVRFPIEIVSLWM